MTSILVNGRKPGASHSLLHGCCWLQFPAISRGRKGDGSSGVLGERRRVCDGAQGQPLASLLSSYVMGGIPAPQRGVLTLSLCLQSGYLEVIEEHGCRCPAGYVLQLMSYRVSRCVAAEP